MLRVAVSPLRLTFPDPLAKVGDYTCLDHVCAHLTTAI